MVASTGWRQVAYRLSRRVGHAVARPTASRRAVPDTLIIGAQRCGTTSLYRQMVEHPAVLGPLQTKGVHWWDANPTRDLTWYRTHFPLRRVVERTSAAVGDPAVVLEASPYYLFHPTAPHRIADDLPGVRAIAILRDPVARAWSHHVHETRRGFEERPFLQALEQEDEALAAAHDRLVADPTRVDPVHMHHGYVARGRYLEQLRRWEDAIGRDRLLVLFSDELRDAPDATMVQVHRFLGISTRPVAVAQRANEQRTAPMPDDARAFLEERLRPLDADLATWLGRPIPWGDTGGRRWTDRREQRR